MAIDIETEDVLTLNEATKALPRVMNKRPAISTIWRWARKGLKGVRLEYVRVGRNIVTTRQALLRFFTARLRPTRRWAANPTLSSLATAAS